MKKLVGIILLVLMAVFVSSCTNGSLLLPPDFSHDSGNGNSNIPNFDPADFISYIVSCPDGVDVSFTEEAVGTSYAIARQAASVNVTGTYSMTDVEYKTFSVNGTLEVLFAASKDADTYTLSSYTIPEQNAFTLKSEDETLSVSLKMEEAESAAGTLTETESRITGKADLSVPSYSSDFAIAINGREYSYSEYYGNDNSTEIGFSDIPADIVSLAVAAGQFPSIFVYIDYDDESPVAGKEYEIKDENGVYGSVVFADSEDSGYLVISRLEITKDMSGFEITDGTDSYAVSTTGSFINDGKTLTLNNFSVEFSSSPISEGKLVTKPISGTISSAIFGGSNFDSINLTIGNHHYSGEDDAVKISVVFQIAQLLSAAGGYGLDYDEENNTFELSDAGPSMSLKGTFEDIDGIRELKGSISETTYGNFTFSASLDMGAQGEKNEILSLEINGDRFSDMDSVNLMGMMG